MNQKIFIYLFVALLSTASLFAQGKFAGSYRSLIHKVYTDKAQLPLSGFTLQSSLFMGDLSISWYRKGNIAVALFESIFKNGFLLHDVLQLSNFSDNQSLRFGNCLNSRAIEDESIIALVTRGKGDLLKAISAWRWNEELKGLESINNNEVNGISCLAPPMSTSQFAGPEWKTFINKTYRDTKEIPALKDYSLREGATLTGNIISVNRYEKSGNDVLVFERILEDNYRYVFDIIETPLTETQEIRIGVCHRGAFDDVGIVAVVQKSNQKQWQAVKAWICDVWHLTLTEVNAKEVTCLGNYGEN